MNETNLGCLNFVSCTAAPSFEVWQHFTLFPIHAGMHLAPPLLCNYGCCEGRKKIIKRLLEAINNMLFESVASLCPGWSNNKRFRFLYTSQWLKRVSFDLWLTVETRQSCPGVFSGLNYRAWVNVKPVSVESRSVLRGGWMFVWGRGNNVSSRGWRVKVLSASEESYRGETASLDIFKVKRELSKSRKPLSEPLQWKQELEINPPETEATFDMILNDLAFFLLFWTDTASTMEKEMNEWPAGHFDFENYKAFVIHFSRIMKISTVYFSFIQ